MDDRLSVLSFGAGAIGSYIGGSLALAGHRVVFLERPDIAGELRTRGLQLEIDGKLHSLRPVQTAGSIAGAVEQGPYDVMLFALKSYDTEAAVGGLAPFAGQLPPVLCLQNGVENEKTIASILGAEKVIAGTVTSAIGRRAAGDVILERKRGMGIAADHPLAKRLVAALNAAGLNARLYERAADMKWSKLLTNLLANASSAILDMTPAEIFGHPGLYDLEVRQICETLSVMEAQSIQVVNLPGTPVRLLTFATSTLSPRLSRPFVKNAVGSGRGGKLPSFYIDLRERRSRSEVDYLNGAVARCGESLDIPTPVNCKLNEILLALSSGQLPLDTYSKQPKKLLAEISYKTVP